MEKEKKLKRTKEVRHTFRDKVNIDIDTWKRKEKMVILSVGRDTKKKRKSERQTEREKERGKGQSGLNTKNDGDSEPFNITN